MTQTELQNWMTDNVDYNYSTDTRLDLKEVSSISLDNSCALYPYVNTRENIKQQFYFDSTHELLLVRLVKANTDEIIVPISYAIDMQTVMGFSMISAVNKPNPQARGSSL